MIEWIIVISLSLVVLIPLTIMTISHLMDKVDERLLRNR